MAKEGQIKGIDVINDDVFERLDRFVKLLDDIILGFQKVQTLGKQATNSISFADAEKENTEAVQKSTRALSEYEKLQKSLEAQERKRLLAQTRLARNLEGQRVETQRLNRENRTAAIIANQNERAYTRLSRQYNEAKKNLKDLIVTTGQYTPAARRQAIEVERLGQKIKQADSLAGDFQRNVGNYPSVLRPAIGVIKQLVGAFGIVEGFRLITGLIRDTTRLAREAKGVEFAFQNIGPAGEESFERIRRATRGLLSDIGIKQTIVEFDNFRLSAEQLDTVLEFVALRNLQTGKSFEFLKNSAIEAITKESVLRADNLGLSQKALNEELEKGADFLTAFTNIAQRELERSGGILDEATNSATKFDATLENVSLSFGKIFTQVKGFGLVNGLFENFGTALELSRKNIEGNFSALESLKISLRLLYPDGLRENRRLLEEANAREKTRNEIDAQIEAYSRLNKIQGIGPLPQNAQIDFDTFADYERQVRTLNDINEELTKYNDILNETDVSDKKKIKSTQEIIKKLEEERKAILGNTEARQESKKILDGSVAAYRAIISELEDERDRLAKSREEYDSYNEKIQEAKNNIEALTRALITLSDAPNIDASAAGGSQLNFDEQDKLAEGFKELQAKRAEDLVLEGKRREQIEEAIATRSLENAKDLNDKQLDALRTAFDLELDLRREFEQAKIDLAFVTADSITQARVQAVDREIEESQRAFDALLNSENLTDEQRMIAQKKFDEEQVKLEKKKRKREREGILIQQGLALVEIAIQLGKTIASINAASAAIDAITPFGFGSAGIAYRAANLPIAIGTAAVQTARVLAQTIPAFFKGKNYTDKYEGNATVNELPGQREVGISKDGRVELFKKGMHIRHVKRDDIIAPSVSAFASNMANPNSEIFKRVASKYGSDTNSRMQVVYVKGQSEEVTSAKDMERAMVRALKKTTLSVNNTVTINTAKGYMVG